MKIDLTQSDIELLLFLMNEAADADTGFGKRTRFSIQELALISKLEKALESSDLIDKIVYSSSRTNVIH